MKQTYKLIFITLLLLGLCVSGVQATLPPPDMLLHMNGPADGTVFVDEGGKTVTVNGVTTNQTIKILGSAAGKFNGFGSNLSLPASSDWDFGDGNFTVMWWEYRTSASDWSAVMDYYGGESARGWMVAYTTAGHNYLFVSSNGTSWDVAAGLDMGTYDLNTRNQYAVIRNTSLGTIKTYKNGVEIASVTSSAAIYNPGGELDIAGDVSGGYGYTGRLDEAAIWKGGPALTIDQLYPMTTEIGTQAPQWDIGNNWTLVNNAAFSTGGRGGSTVLNFNGTLYSIAGSAGIRTNETYKSSNNGKTWTLVNASSGFSNRSFAFGWVYHDVMYLAGGNDGTKNLNDTWSSTDGDIWTLLNSSAGWSIRHAAMPLVYDDKMYLMGGNHDSTEMADIWTSTDGNVWTQVSTTAVWPGRELGGAGYIGPAMYVWGGLSSTDYLTDTWESDNKGVTWYQTNTTGFRGRYGFNGVSVDSRIMFGAGTNATSTVPNFLLSTNGTIWTETNSSIVPFDRYYTSTVAVNNSGIVMVGGYNATSGFLNDVWVSGDFPPIINPITADFSSFNTQGTAPFTTYLYDTSTNLTGSETFGWDLGDGNMSTAQNLFFTWNITGEYVVNHSVSNGLSTSYSQANVTVGTPVSAPVASFYGSPTTGNVPLTVSFTDVSSNTPTSWNWSFGDGIYSELQNPTHQYTRSGFRTVNLTATNSAGSNVTTRLKFVKVS